MKQVKKCFRKWREFRYRHPIPFLATRYIVLWLLAAAYITDLSGKSIYQREADSYGRDLTLVANNEIKELSDYLKTMSAETAMDHQLLQYCMQNMTSSIANRYFNQDTYVACRAYNESLSIESNQCDRAFLVMLKDGTEAGGKVVLSCPLNYFDDLKLQTTYIRENAESQWTDPFILRGSLSYSRWDVTLDDGYVNGDEFIPGNVTAKYGYYRYNGDSRTVDCTPKTIPDGYVKMFVYDQNRILFPGDTNQWISVSMDGMYELGYKGVDFTGNGRLIDLLLNGVPSSGSKTNLLNDQIKIGSKEVVVPLSFLKGNITYEYQTIMTDVNGEYLIVEIRCIMPELLSMVKRTVYRELKTEYLIIFVILALLALIDYRLLYSLRAKNGFHKSLINSMAHDLKSPLMIMQGFGENLVENVHQEKRQYYAEEILSSIHYLNELVDKNLDVSKHDGETEVKREKVIMMELIDEAKKRYADLLEQKKCTIEKNGNMYVLADRALLKVVIDNLIANAIKYSPDGETIDAVAKDKCFLIQNKAELTYGKNIKHLLDPLEMGEESRTAGQGMGLGLSIVNGIIREHGWRMKLKYDKKKKLFTCMITVPFWNKIN